MVKAVQSTNHKDSGYQRPKQKWLCGRLDGQICQLGPTNKGKCQQQEKCQPSRSIKSKRGYLTQWVSMVTVALLALAFTIDKAWLFNSGPLSSSHATIDNCAVCHSNFNSTISTWFHQTITLEAGDSNQQCLRCHIRKKHAFSPHNLSKATLNKLTESQNQRLQQGLADKTIAPNDMHVMHIWINESLHCGTCHREHKGNSIHLINTSNERCQVCHLQTFESFSTNHPQFDQYPYSRRTRIRFDHVNHFNKHFYEEEHEDKAPQKCQTCHVNDSAGNLKQLTGYDQTCDQCHGEQIRNYSDASAKGIPVLSIPQLDTETLEKRGFYVGQWPTRGAESLTPVNEYIVYPTLESRALKKKIENLVWYDLSNANDEQLQILTDVAWRLKQFYYGLDKLGMGYFIKQAQSLPRKDLTLSQISASLNLLSKPAVTLIEKNYFTDLSNEVEAYRLNKSIAYDPAKRQKQNKAQTNIAQTTNIDTNPHQPHTTSDTSVQPLSNDDELLVDLFDLDIDDMDLEEMDAEEDEAKANEREKSDKQTPFAVNSEEWAATGGWYWDKSILYYRPTGHADLLLKTWIDLSSSNVDNPISKNLFNRLMKNDAVGFCGKCHTVDSDPKTGANKVNWYALRGSKSGKTFTRFSHSTHSSLSLERGCRSCHIIDNKADYESGFKDRDPSQFASNFKPMDIESCSSCHVSESAGDDCLQCHNYHIGDFGNPLLDIQNYSSPPELIE